MESSVVFQNKTASALKKEFNTLSLLWKHVIVLCIGISKYPIFKFLDFNQGKVDLKRE